MRLLLDSHVLLWWRSSPATIEPSAHRAIEEAESAFVSLASVWELAIKVGVGRLTMREPFATAVESGGFAPLAITFAHAARVATLPHLHRDPFDRMLVAQADVEGLTLVTRDRMLAAYSIPILAA